MKTSQVLIEAKALINTPDKWLQGDYTNDDKTCFCSLGAIAFVSGIANYGASITEAGRVLQKVVRFEIGYDKTFAVFNDNYSHSRVMQAFDTAIESAIESEDLTNE